MRALGLTVHGFSVEIFTDSLELVERITQDFYHFLGPAASSFPILRLTAQLGPIPQERIPQDVRGVRNKNSVAYQSGKVRVNLYDDVGGEALSVLNLEDPTQEKAEVFSPDMHRLHETTYLLILSRVGKLLERRGEHRVHAMGVSLHGRTLLALMPMGGGKTTLFMHLLGLPGAEILSDDSPLLKAGSGVMAFPLRVGIEPKARHFYEDMAYVDLSQHYVLKRRQYGEKLLIPLTAIKAPIYQGGVQPVVLVCGVKTEQTECRIVPTGWATFIWPLILNLVVGVGLPVMREYFIEGTLKDVWTIFRILVSRIRAALWLLKTSEKYKVFLASDPRRNAEAMDQLVRSSFGKSAKYARPAVNPTP